MPEKPIFIYAQTGKGKNYFIEKTLIPYVKKLNDYGYRNRMLILSNRIALSLQTKKRIMEILNLEKEIEELTITGIINWIDFDFITVLSYQGLQYRMNFLNEYAYVICDEAHFFTSDAMFNPYTDLILSMLTKKFQRSIRIYMTATFDDCINYICEKEHSLFNKKLTEQDIYRLTLSNINEMHGRFICYKFDRNFSYLNIQYFSVHSELKEIIVNNNDKWLIFIDNLNSA